MKNSKGITLIALVVTIVVLLILATVSISMLTGENGIITQAQNAKLETRGGEVEERVNLWKTEKKTSKYTNQEVKTDSELLEEMKADKILFEQEIDRENKIITIGRRIISYRIDEEITEDGEVILNPDIGKEELILEYTVETGDIIELPYNLEWFNLGTGEEKTATYNFQVDWGDGTVVTEINNENITTDEKSKHQYINSGIYEVKIKGNYEAISIFSNKDAPPMRVGYDKLTKVKQWGTTGLKNIILVNSISLSEMATPTQGSFKELVLVSFLNCKNLKGIPDKMFANCTNLQIVESVFEECTNLTTIGDYAFANCTNIKSFSNTFKKCTNLTTIGDYAFAYCTGVESFGWCFGDYTNLTTIGDFAFTNCTNVQSFESTFDGCTNLTTIGDYAFAYCTNAENFAFCFGYTNLTTIGKYAFANCTKTQSFKDCFFDCVNLTTIGDYAFSNCTNVQSFEGTFDVCTNLTTIGEYAFSNCTNVQSFEWCFEGYTNLTTVGDYAFSNCTNVQSFESIFEGCTNLTTIGESIFEGCTNVQNFRLSFSGCENLQGNIPKLWLKVQDGEKNGYVGIPDGYNCFYNCRKLDNYEEIPDYWKGANN